MEFRVLGPMEVEGPNGPVKVGGGKRRALLALLVLRANEVVTADALVEALWAEAMPSSPRTALQVLVSDLRKELGEVARALKTRGGGYVLEVDEDAVDIRRFERRLAAGRRALGAGSLVHAQGLLRSALELWRGEPLQEFSYDDFAQAEIARLAGLRIDAEEALVDTELALGADAELVPRLEKLVGAHPEREHLRGQLMLSLYRAQRQSDALAAYGDARAWFDQELGIEPGLELRRLQHQILNQDPALDRSRPAPEPSATKRQRAASVVAALVLATAATVAVVLLRGSPAAAPTPPVQIARQSVAVVQPASGRILASIPLLAAPRATPLQPTDIAFGFGSLWVTDAGEQVVLRVDAKSRRVVGTIGVGGDVRALAIGFGSVWVADGNSAAVTRIDPRSDQVIATIPLGEGGWSYALTAGADSVWAVAGSRFVTRIDPRTNKVVERIPIGDVNAIAATADSVFCGTREGAIELIRPRRARVRVSTLARTDRPVQRLLVEDHELWTIVQGPQFELWRYDTRDGRLISTIELGQIALGLAATPSGVFVPIYREGELITVKPEPNTITQRLVLRPGASLAASGDGLVWVLIR